MTTIPRVDVLGVHVSAVNMPSAVAEVSRWIAEGRRRYICVTGVHGVMESRDDDDLRAIHNASGMTTPDGMPLVWASRYAGMSHVRRVYGPDLMLALCEEAVRHGWRFFLYGGRDGVPERLADRLRARFPGLQIVGCWSPPFRELTSAEHVEVDERINAARPDVVWVGLSTPKQERWMAAHRDRLDAPALIGVGAAFDIHAGLVRQAPGWMQRSGLEWAFRLSQEPGRLWRRYLRSNPRFVAAVLRSRPRLVTEAPSSSPP